jgi:hypothetical protein
MVWEVQVIGPNGVLAELASAVGDEPAIVETEGRFTLRSRRLDQLTDAPSVREEAKRIVEALSGISRVLLDSDDALGVGSVTDLRPDGRQNIFLEVEPAVISIKDGVTSFVVTRSDGTAEQRRRSDPAPRWLAKALCDPALSRALRLRDAGELSWTDLYRLYEVIEDACGGEDVIVANRWTTRTRVRRLKHSANSVSAAGDDARHGIERSSPPTSPMTLPEARSLVDDLLKRSLDS